MGYYEWILQKKKKMQTNVKGTMSSKNTKLS